MNIPTLRIQTHQRGYYATAQRQKTPIMRTRCGKCALLYDGNCPNGNNPNMTVDYEFFGNKCPSFKSQETNRKSLERA